MNLNFVLMTGKTVSLSQYHGPEATIREIKEAAKEELDLPTGMQQLYYDGELLKDGRAAASYGIGDGSTLRVIGVRPSSAPSPSQGAAGMRLNFVLMSGETVSLESSLTTIREIKEEAKEELHLLPDMQQLYHGGELLEDDRAAASYGIGDGSTLRVIGMRPSSAPLHPSQARLLATFMDSSRTAKADSEKEVWNSHTSSCSFERKMPFRTPGPRTRDPQPRQEAAGARTLQVAAECGRRWAAADAPLRFRMRSRLLSEVKSKEDPTVDEDLQRVLRQRDYLIQRQVGLIKKNGAMVAGFIEELKSMCAIDMGAEATVSTYDATLVREAAVVRGQIEPTLAVGADVACGAHHQTNIHALKYRVLDRKLVVVSALREKTAAAVAEMERSKEESEVLRYEQYKWKTAKRSLEFDLRQLQLTLDAVLEELLHLRKQVRSTAPDYKEVKAMFSAMDHDGSGRLEAHEVKGLCSQLRTLVLVELSDAEMAAAVRRMDRDGDGKPTDTSGLVASVLRSSAKSAWKWSLRTGDVDFNEFFQWYEQEMTEARMRDQPLYGEVKALFDSLDEDGSGTLDQTEVRSIVETLLAPLDEASGTARSLTTVVSTACKRLFSLGCVAHTDAPRCPRSSPIS
eukprot:COSAG04_NODE_1168_length_7978_cov_4.222998_9_plen_627_part_00